jgi:hypothetical protein
MKADLLPDWWWDLRARYYATVKLWRLLRQGHDEGQCIMDCPTCTDGMAHHHCRALCQAHPLRTRDQMDAQAACFCTKLRDDHTHRQSPHCTKNATPNEIGCHYWRCGDPEWDRNHKDCPTPPCPFPEHQRQ